MAHWSNKPVAFKSGDKADEARHDFAKKLPNFTADVKALLDQMMAGGYKSFDAWLDGLHKYAPTQLMLDETTLHNFVQNHATEVAAVVVEVDASQFL